MTQLFGLHLLLMLQPLVLQGFSEDGDVLQSLQELNAGLGVLHQEHALPVGLLLLYQHLQDGGGGGDGESPKSQVIPNLL